MNIDDEMRKLVKAEAAGKADEPLLYARGRTHGSFEDNANIAQDLKSVLRSQPKWEQLHPIHAEALDLICTKIARIMSGHADFADHWVDVAGYAKLGESKCTN